METKMRYDGKLDDLVRVRVSDYCLSGTVFARVGEWRRRDGDGRHRSGGAGRHIRGRWVVGEA